MAAAFVDRLTPVLIEGDLVAARVLLDALEGGELTEAKAWFAGNRRWLGELDPAWAGDDPDARFDTRHRAAWILGMCAVRLCGPVTAAKRVPWSVCWDYMNNPGEAAFVQLLWDTDRAWVAEFVEAASHVRLGASARNVNGQLARAVRAAAAHHGLRCPTGPTFLACWWAGTGKHATLADRLAADPFMPDLLLHYLASGHCGDLPDLPEAVADLTARGTVDRDCVLAHVLDLLTAPQRPRSQRVLAQITRALRLTPQEVPGGLTYLLGVLASGHAGVVPLLLPLAMDLVADADGLVQLASVLAARPEKQPKETLLAALPGLSASVGTPGALVAIELLRAGDDAVFTARADRVAAALGAPAPAPTPPAARSGLWDLDPTPTGPQLRVEDWVREEGDWSAVLDARYRRRDRVQPWLVEKALTAMVRGTFEGTALRRAAATTLEQRHFVPSALAAVLDDLFLAGGMRQVWPVALEIADLACGATSRPPGIAELLRTLARYAAEVPRPWPVPPHIAALAAAAGSTKAQTEARRLLAALTGETPDTVAARLREAVPVVRPAAPRRRGLWDVPAPSMSPLPSRRRLQTPTDPVVERARDLGLLRELLAENYNGYAQSYEDILYRHPHWMPSRSRTSLTQPDRVLAATVGAVHLHGADSVRTALAGIEREYPPVDVVMAIDAWLIGTLDLASFWRVARGRVVPLQDLLETWAATGSHRNEVAQRSWALPSFPQRLAQPDHPDVGALVLPSELASPPERLAFLRAAEALLRAERHPSLLSTPTWADGTLDLDDLLVRLAEAAAAPEPAVGPIDLVQALHRLRPVDAARAGDVPHNVRTDPALTDPGGEISWDATGLVRTWISAGGLPPLDPVWDDESGWSTAAVAPVPFQRLAALPAALADDPWNPGRMCATVRMMPRWGDRVVTPQWGEGFPSHIAGPFGVPLHDRLLNRLTPTINVDSLEGVPILVEVAQRRRLVPQAAAAAAVIRHERGDLRLRLLVRVLEKGFEAGGAFPGVWPSALAMADALCAARTKAAGLPELLRLLTAYAHEVPAAAIPVLPENLCRFARSRGSTRSHTEARGLVEALRAARAAGDR